MMRVVDCVVATHVSKLSKFELNHYYVEFLCKPHFTKKINDSTLVTIYLRVVSIIKRSNDSYYDNRNSCHEKVLNILLVLPIAE